jgi:hypothetical protein
MVSSSLISPVRRRAESLVFGPLLTAARSQAAAPTDDAAASTGIPDV